ncbi:Uncharacterized protein TCM_003024 [Theobroma cacao]|uniref:Uncharacterized protein n=1 Tax=Theobroma cacao TaxID=3641 RepID=A0A061DVE6_THECC|nr:Uncharacterized protein TCM_003024 [Theobroma cacao]
MGFFFSSFCSFPLSRVGPNRSLVYEGTHVWLKWMLCFSFFYLDSFFPFFLYRVFFFLSFFLYGTARGSLQHYFFLCYASTSSKFQLLFG